MRKTLSLLVAFVILVSCSEKDTIEPPVQQEFPSNITIPDAQSAKAGEILTINGSVFSTNETYVVTFAENEVGTIKEVNTNYLKVEIPENAVSGDIKLTVNNETKVIGSIDIVIEPIPVVNDVYVFHDSENKLAKIDLETGNLTYLGENISYGANTRGAVFHKTNNEYIGFENGFTTVEIVRISIADGSANTVTIPDSFLTNGADFSDLIIDNDDNVYIFHDSENKLAKIDLETGNLTYIGENINYGANTRGAVYHKTNNEYIGFENDFTSPKLVRINLTDGTTSSVTIPSSFLTNGADFSDLVIDNDDNVYIFHNSENKLAKIDVNSGELTYIGSNISYGANSIGAIYNSSNNEYLGLENDATSAKLVTINITDGATSTVTIPSSFLTNGTDFSDLIITRN
ncbi:IPT/TIG domain-containing protein [Tenacibaculum sp. M341]|uniref:IPT/TIG domain-containing protein n=1 Tax=Tenacibaculum sp. M341 TaxID=2530339 RepID=UPI0010506671|nr:IPT/TIG domain-containing protein [Tenacibaculum sp. M341]TCI84877.1 hypothetical protein EYW44_19260 [Tenacibaculum sp. M341]